MSSLNHYIERGLGTVIACMMHEKDEFSPIINHFHSNHVKIGLYHERRVHYTHQESLQLPY